MIVTPQEVLDFWFVETPKEYHFKKDAAFDEKIRARFLETYEAAKSGELDSWRAAAGDCLALIILLDQFSRNMFRDTPASFATDAQALALAKYAVEQKYDLAVADSWCIFFYTPFEHSEDIAEQNKSVALFSKQGLEEWLKFVQAHQEIIARFGRFPHRNKILGRQSTPEEIEFLKQPNSSF